MAIASHISHEAQQKIGGIGSVINGLLTSSSYQAVFKQSLVYGPLFDKEVVKKMTAQTNFKLLFFNQITPNMKMANQLRAIENQYNITILYGKKKLNADFSMEKNGMADIILVDTKEMKQKPVDVFKYLLWQEFGIKSNLFPDWDYEQYVRIAIPYREILTVLYPGQPVVHFAHEYMGIPSVLSVVVEKRKNLFLEDRTVFYAHEISTIRSVVENHPGHDITFYNIMDLDMQQNIHLEKTFGEQQHNYRHELVKNTASCDLIFAVSDIVNREYQYLISGIDKKKIKTVYNGIDVEPLTFTEKEQCRSRINQYCHILLNFEPDISMTHVCRLIPSKGIWRDIKFLYYLDEIFEKKGLKGFYLLLSSLIATGRPETDILSMEQEYGWPVLHQKNWPDLVGVEEDIYHSLEIFNSRSKRIKGIFINQFGFDPKSCGLRVPEDMSFKDIRMGSDLEFGLSIYEPFGISQIETLPFGGIPVTSSNCGSYYLMNKIFAKKEKLFFPIDFNQIPKPLKNQYTTKKDFLDITSLKRSQMEELTVKRTVPSLFKMIEKLLHQRKHCFSLMQQCGQELSWDNIIKKYFISHFV